jgi:integrase
MGSLPTRGGVRAKGTGRVQFDFNFHGTRYRPTIVAEPTESNLQRARAKLRRIKVPIAAGTFSFNEEFPSYRYKQRLARSFSPQTCNDVFDAYLAHCAARLAKFDLAYATLASYRRAIDSTWRPAIGSRRFDQVNRRSRGAHHRDSSGLGQAQGNYDEFRFFTGLRPSEEIALLVSDCDLVKGTIAITKARVMARDKDRTKTSEDRTVQLCSRASDVLKRQLALRERWQRLGVCIDHGHVFFKDDGEPLRHLHYGWKRWRHSLERLGLRPRAPYKARHSFITWSLMLGKNPLWVAKQHGHSAHLMLDVYANWIEVTEGSEMAAIEQAMQRAPAIWHQRGTSAVRSAQAPKSTRKYVAEREGFEPSMGF